MRSVERNPEVQHQTRHALRLIPAAAADALYAALERGKVSSVPPDSLQYAAKSICRGAHASRCPVERMLAELKPEWSMLLDSVDFPRGADRTEVTSRFISCCIDEYFRREGLDAQDGQPRRGLRM